MKVLIDTEARTLQIDENPAMDLYGRQSFDLVADLWLKTSWNQKYSYTFTWMGRPVIQHPDDMVRLQEVIFNLRPDVIIETGVAHGGSLIYSASILKSMGLNSRVVGVDIEIRKHNREAIEAHDLFEYITLIEGDSVSDEVIDQVRQHVKPDDVVLVILDSDHSYGHVTKELDAYCQFVTDRSYIVSTDGIMRLVHDVPNGQPDWITDNPANAAEDFAARKPEFAIDEPGWNFNESELDKWITAWPSAWLKKVG